MPRNYPGLVAARSELAAGRRAVPPHRLPVLGFGVRHYPDANLAILIHVFAARGSRHCYSGMKPFSPCGEMMATLLGVAGQSSPETANRALARIPIQKNELVTRRAGRPRAWRYIPPKKIKIGERNVHDVYVRRELIKIEPAAEARREAGQLCGKRQHSRSGPRSRSSMGGSAQ